MPPAHRNGDPRNCGAVTVVAGQGSTFVDGKLWAVNGDPNSHGQGNLIASCTAVAIESKAVIVHAPDDAKPDLQGHSNPRTAGGSGATRACG